MTNVMATEIQSEGKAGSEWCGGGASNGATAAPASVKAVTAAVTEVR
jgi:hypothetical protein